MNLRIVVVICLVIFGLPLLTDAQTAERNELSHPSARPFHPLGTLPRLKVSDNKRFLVTEGGQPFFWLADTGWFLFQKLDRQEVDKYVSKRVEQQFSVILAHVLPWQPGETNVYGEPAFIDRDFTKPNPTYWRHADHVVEQSAAKGLYLALLPMWALNYIEPKKGSLDTTERIDAKAAYTYGKFLGDRYRTKTNLVWVLGGDVTPTRHNVYDALAKGITDGMGGDADEVLFSYHPPSRKPSSAGFCHDRPWLDFNLLQSGHDIWRLNYETIAANYALTPTKPTADGEPCYENHPIRHDFKNGVFKDYHMRMRAYWSLFAGGFGYTYGGNGVWQMDKAGNEPFLKTHTNLSWDQALTLPGAEQMKYVRRLMESRPFLSRVPDSNTLLRSPKGEKAERIEVTHGSNRTWAMFYLTSGQSVQPTIAGINGTNLNAWWFNPRDGKVYDADGQPTNKPFARLTQADDKRTLDPPGEPSEGNDWVLVLDNAAKNYPVPGTPVQVLSRSKK